MGKIKKVFLHNKKLLNKLASYTGYDFFTTGFAPFPFDILNSLLPLNLKFFQDSYFILANKDVKGFVSLEKEKGSKKRININKFFLNSNSLEYGEQLINYVTTKYSLMGATSFNVKFDHTYQEITNLLVSNCKFRICSYEKIYKINDIKKNNDVLNYFSRFSNKDAKDVNKLSDYCIQSFLMNTFSKTEVFFKDDIIGDIDSKTRFKYVFRANNEDDIQGFFSITSTDNKNYVIDLILDPAYSPYFLDILNFCSMEIQKRNKDFSIYVKINKCYSNFEDLNYILECEQGANFVKQNVILTKDYYVPVKEEEGNRAVFFDALSLKSN